MSLTLTEKSGGSSVPLLEEGTYPAVCCALVDLGEQYNEKFGKLQKKLIVGWEVIGESVEIDGELKPRTFYRTYTASLNEKSELRKHLKAWRGRDFTAEELTAFDLKNIIGAPCFIQIIHNTATNGNTYANLAAVTKLPKGYPSPKGELPPMTYDIEGDDPAAISALPAWMQELIRKSSSYQSRTNAAGDSAAPQFTELGDAEDGELPF